MQKTSIPQFVSDIFPDENTIVNITSDGNCNELWNSKSKHNALYLTDRCNSRCIMCPQPDNKNSYYDICSAVIDTLTPAELDYTGITGGEPTLDMEILLNLINKISQKSKTKPFVHILTNGRKLADIENVQKLAEIKNCDITFGIPLYSPVSEEHDFITGVRGSFCQTIKGLYNLAKYRQKIELRVVILRQNYKNLSDLVEFIYRNLPFTVNIAFMGTEYHGRAEENYELVGIDPNEYRVELFNAIRECIRRDMNTGIYNLPYCLVDERIEDYCRDSISDWEKTYLPQCENCSKKTSCSGVFSTSFIHSENIRPYSTLSPV
ncbi:MAG: His-Xaa-Ser system radical SAM maturase HxsC [Candidatus Gastranaerophilales bacterium]|nr:His-Xaa-Ser system radical SAM maturase HxsC [Candidatus Gastranaerophilales bacterium]